MEHATNAPTATTAYVLGIDTGRDQLDLALLSPDGKLHTKSVRNDERGFKKLLSWVSRLAKGQSNVHACLEASGGYEEAAALFLHGNGILVSVVNPRQIKAYAGVHLQRSKTDKADAALIARFCQREQPTLWQPPTPEQQELRQMTRALEALKRERDRMRNRLGRHDDGVAGEAFGTVLQAIKEQIRVLEHRIEDHIAAHPELERQRDLLVTIPGVGTLTAAVVLAELGAVSRFESARQAAAYAGLVPSEFGSGTSVKRRTRLSKLGSSRLRKAFYFPAVTALRCNEVVKCFGARLAEKGKAKKAVVGAAMRKLLHICFGVLRSGRPFDPSLHLTT